MRAVRVTIHNFRSICDATIQLAPYGLLVGANNSGKSSVIDAIRAFYGKGIRFDADRDHPKQGAADEENWVEVEFRPTPEELTTLKEDYRSTEGTFTVRNYFRSAEKEGGGTPRSGLYAYVGGKLADDRFYGFKSVGQGKFGELVYIPAVSKVDEHTKLSGPSALRDLVNAVLSSVLDASPAYADLRSSFETFEGLIKTEATADGVSLDSIETLLSNELTSWGAKFRLNVNPIGTEEIVKSLIGHDVVDESLGIPQPVSAYGQGFQRSVIFALIRVAASISSPKSVSKKKEFSPDLTWILFEEPEAFLHPTQAARLSADLRDISGAGTAQVLLTTHSPQFASHSVGDLPCICRLQRLDAKTTAHQPSVASLTALMNSNQADTSLWKSSGVKVDTDDLMVDLESIKYALWLDARRSAAFFAQRVLLVEGPTEVAVAAYLRDKGYFKGVGEVFVVDTLGKYNIHRFMRLFGEFGIPHAVLHDGDDGANAVITKTIQESRNSYTTLVESFPDDIEAFLGIPKAKQPHRKPQHALYHLGKGTVAQSNLAALVTLLRKLFLT